MLASLPFEPNTNKAHCTKTDWYFSDINDVTALLLPFKCDVIEIYSKGLIDTDNKNKMTRLSKDMQSPVKFSEFKNTLTKSGLMPSYSIF